ncbi:GNAT family N-acetyltransferase [Prosthecochloris sp. GSB1]|uniref:GNAT family N-acetyltransferase n=1 Tax=Prosthecochloris sp. GSB1 TaxID=281093 RepID=UPI000B8CAF88|nr:GNAT family N-acetyltransferase [Prosthecochloris sp. GSB1]ASQ90626.1 GNAT family N-acetyltransferase [Prosthecochloris sp. GSB1]
MSGITVNKVLRAEDRRAALEIVEQVFLREKQWISTVGEQLPEVLEENGRFSWFLARMDGEPAGVLRLLYDPVLELPGEYDVRLLPGVDVERMKRDGRYVEIGRFMIGEAYRRNPAIALRLMRTATREVIERDYTHFITDVFEGEKHSPLNFHTRVLGFEVIGKHLFGDLNCSSTRIILTLDILKVYGRIRNSRSKVYRELTEGIRGILERKMSSAVR